MSSLAILPLSRDAGMADVTTMPLLADRSSGGDNVPHGPDKTRQYRSGVKSPGWNGDLSHYQAQIIGAELAKSYARHQAATTPRSAARAYAQARRRPETTGSQPRLQAVM